MSLTGAIIKMAWGNIVFRKKSSYPVKKNNRGIRRFLYERYLQLLTSLC